MKTSSTVLQNKLNKKNGVQYPYKSILTNYGQSHVIVGLIFEERDTKSSCTEKGRFHIAHVVDFNGVYSLSFPPLNRVVKQVEGV